MRICPVLEVTAGQEAQVDAEALAGQEAAECPLWAAAR